MKEKEFKGFTNIDYNKNNNNNKNIVFKTNENINNHRFTNEYGQLEYIKTIEEHNKTINDIIALENMIYLTYDNNKYFIANANANEGQPCYKEEELGNNAKINKIIYSSGKLIFSVEFTNEINGSDEKGIINKLYVITQNNNIININTNDKPIDIIEIENAIITFGKKYIEAFRFIPNNNEITKETEILFNKTDDEIYKITCVIRVDKKLICGHASGHISNWLLNDEQPYLKNTLLRKIHNKKINKMIMDTNNNIISVSADKTLKVHTLEETICYKVIDFQDEVMDIKKVNDLENKINYIISLKNGMINVYNTEFKNTFNIMNRSNIFKTRYVLSISNLNNNNDNNKENYVLITEDNKIDLYKWNKKEEIKRYKKNFNYNNKFNKSKKYYNINYKYSKKQ